MQAIPIGQRQAQSRRKCRIHFVQPNGNLEGIFKMGSNTHTTRIDSSVSEGG
jgi:hypothetical protein